MPKILYAASNRMGAHHQLMRFLSHISSTQYDIKIAGYKRMGSALRLDFRCLAKFFCTQSDISSK